MAELDGNWIHGRPDLGTIPGQRAFVSRCCGIVAPVPSHQPYCDARHAARIWNSAPAAAVRKASADLRAFLDATPLGDPDDIDQPWQLEYAALCGALHAAATGLLAELDREAGAS